VLLRYWNTIRYLRAEQILWRLRYVVVSRFRYLIVPPKIDRGGNLPVTQINQHWENYISRNSNLKSVDRAVFLNIEADISCPSIWNDTKQSKLWLYNLHYFDDLAKNESPGRNKWLQTLIARWIQENPIGHGNGWEPYPTSRRIVNWIKWGLSGNLLDDAMNKSIAIQTRWLRDHLEYHLLGNHLVANAKALCFAGLYFDGAEADEWLTLGMTILKNETEEQILPDGAHYELSPMYHLIVLEDLLDLKQIIEISEISTPSFLDKAIVKMLSWSSVMRHPDGLIPFFNDANFGGCSEPVALDCYARTLGYSIVPNTSGIICLKESGYVRIHRGLATLFCDLACVGPDYLPAHSHADTLSFEFSLDNHRVVVNGGTSTYEKDSERQRQRGTPAHSTVTINRENSSDVWASFRTGKRARVTKAQVNVSPFPSIFGEHNGYKSLPGAPIHQRNWQLSDSNLKIIDQISGNAYYDLEINFLLGPKLRPQIVNPGVIELINESNSTLVCSFHSSQSRCVSIETTTWHPEFGISVDIWRLVIRSRHKGIYTHEARFAWSSNQ
jgi:uncharacterized heparinase superfamily protein